MSFQVWEYLCLLLVMMAVTPSSSSELRQQGMELECRKQLPVIPTGWSADTNLAQGKTQPVTGEGVLQYLGLKFFLGLSLQLLDWTRGQCFTTSAGLGWTLPDAFCPPEQL
ncbi:hypothetical protein DV515_00005715 [Chloebia gouldiae]|uniref:Uncharacterized protein n=1 Tax=Chloebia gouldiae TaxID=44316 RepID=A0A3L8SNP9_CHLGU|nr:hypothetical protein DV515_00005715 [Chloebia gouldiae]